jgi:hypothetical protein
MNKIILLIVLVFACSEREVMEINGHFWYSEKQKEVRSSQLGMPRSLRCRLKDGSEREYTEMTGRKKNTSNFDDIEYLGKGIALWKR